MNRIRVLVADDHTTVREWLDDPLERLTDRQRDVLHLGGPTTNNHAS
jgi:hypothetical protein